MLQPNPRLLDPVEGAQFLKTSTIDQWYFVTEIVLTYCEKKCSSDQEKL